ncbi:hypothetical protein EST38_g12871 [Candolleomyces aberdarensis]|uniref:VCBS repeat-containing protein n=1 Tax=Candolleomyces aberdarensis TaxID=2316362 RepID=A0A4Q2D3M9_9AGAR|nr:hypothetical protein EST38_g12871 [Candolleomyces aberdarensis]
MPITIPDAASSPCPIITQDRPVPTSGVGTADIVGFGQDGVVILRNNFQSLSIVDVPVAIKHFGSKAGGWVIDKHIRLLGDTTGSGKADIIGFGHGGVWVAQNQGENTFGPSTLRVQEFGYGAGDWRVDKHLRYVADLRKTGRVDIIGFSDWGVVVSLNNGDGTFGPVQIVLYDLGYEQGWKLDKHLRLLGDVTGNGLPDIVAFGEDQVFVAVNNGDGTFQPLKLVLNMFAYSDGWRIENHIRSLADLTGNGCVDIVGFGEAGVWASFSNGDGTFQPGKLVSSEFGRSGSSLNWSVGQHPRFLADLTGDGRADIIGFAHAGVYVALNNGDGTFQPSKCVLTAFGFQAGGWTVEKHPRFVVDLTGNGCADILGFADDGVYVSYNDGKGNFSPPQKLTSHFGSNDVQWTPNASVRLVVNLYK